MSTLPHQTPPEPRNHFWLGVGITFVVFAIMVIAGFLLKTMGDVSGIEEFKTYLDHILHRLAGLFV